MKELCILPPLVKVNLSLCLINDIKKNTETLIDATKEVGVEENREKTKYMLLPRHQIAG
jgi:hypothetical protein